MIIASFCIPLCVCVIRVERSTDQVIKPINIEALSRWAASVPSDVRRDIDKLAPMLQRLGYDSHAYPPKYDTADEMVVKNTYLVRHNMQYWNNKKEDIEKQDKLAYPVASDDVLKSINNNMTRSVAGKENGLTKREQEIDEEYSKMNSVRRRPGEARMFR